MATLVKFRIEPTRSVIAIFPQLKESNGLRTDLITCYSHNGQHSAAAPEYVAKLRKAKPKEFTDLKEELESIGYNLRVFK